tara:strand:- start:2559 stop:3512 length:954 start_codon:yes stop_codon:yes gene_type:complete
MGDFAHYLKQGEIDKIQKAFVEAKVQDKQMMTQYALLTSKSYVISLFADTTEHCDHPHSTCFVSCIYKLRVCYGIPIRVIPYALGHFNVKASTDTNIAEFIRTLEDLREAEFAQSSVDMISSSEPTNDAWRDLRKRSRESVKFLKRSEWLTLSPESRVCEKMKKNALDRLAAMNHYGMSSAHVALLGLGDCTVDELRSIPGLVVVFPTWVTLECNLRDPAKILGIFEFIRGRYSSFDELIFKDCVPLAPYADHRVNELNTLQNIPAWEWGRIAIVHAWIRSKHRTVDDVTELCRMINLKEKYTNIMVRLKHRPPPQV